MKMEWLDMQILKERLALVENISDLVIIIEMLLDHIEVVNEPNPDVLWDGF